jgi:site-specific recombinase XerD
MKEFLMFLKSVAKTILVLLSAYLDFWALATFAEHRAKPISFGAHTHQTNEWVFPDTNNKAYFLGTPKVLLKVRAMAALDDVRLHDLRHSAASFGLAGGLGLEVIGKLLGHQDVKTTGRYAHLSDGYMRAAEESMAGGIAELLQVKSIK